MGVSLVRREGSLPSVDPQTRVAFEAPFDPEALWSWCDRCKGYLNAVKVDLVRRVALPYQEIDDRPIREYYENLDGPPAKVIFPRVPGEPFPGETNLQYRIRTHEASHSRADSMQKAGPRRGRPSRIERRYRYVLYTNGSMSAWPVDEMPDPKFADWAPAGATIVEQGITDRPDDARFIGDRRAHKLAKNREYVRRHRAKSR